MSTNPAAEAWMRKTMASLPISTGQKDITIEELSLLAKSAPRGTPSKFIKYLEYLKWAVEQRDSGRGFHGLYIFAYPTNLTSIVNLYRHTHHA